MSTADALPHNRRAMLAWGAGAFVVAMIGERLTVLGDWYRSLTIPSWQPPDLAFAPAWTLIFGLTAAAGYYAWRAAPSTRARAGVIAGFLANAALNIGCVILFFPLQRPDWALIGVPVLWLSILGLILLTRRWSTTAAWLLVPYLVWQTFAAAINYAVVDLNYPFT